MLTLCSQWLHEYIDSNPAQFKLVSSDCEGANACACNAPASERVSASICVFALAVACAYVCLHALCPILVKVVTRSNASDQEVKTSRLPLSKIACNGTRGAHRKEPPNHFPPQWLQSKRRRLNPKARVPSGKGLCEAYPRGLRRRPSSSSAVPRTSKATALRHRPPPRRTGRSSRGRAARSSPPGS